MSLADLLERAGSTLGHRTSLIVITPSVDSEWQSALEIDFGKLAPGYKQVGHA